LQARPTLCASGANQKIGSAFAAAHEKMYSLFEELAGERNFRLLCFLKSIPGSPADGAFFRGAVRTEEAAEAADKIPGICFYIYIPAIRRIKGPQPGFRCPQLRECMKQGWSFISAIVNELCVVFQYCLYLFFKNRCQILIRCVNFTDETVEKAPGLIRVQS
jgi:hypothetical protein